MRINFYATLRAVAGGKCVDVEVPSPQTLRSVLKEVTRVRPDLGTELWNTPAELHDHIRVFLNGRDRVHLPLGLDTPVAPTDTIDVFPPVGGG